MIDLYKELEALAEVEENIPLSKMTTLRIGGVARYVVYPENTLSLQGVMNKLNQNHIPYKVIGKGSGRTKQAAGQEAAYHAILALKNKQEH